MGRKRKPEESQPKRRTAMQSTARLMLRVAGAALTAAAVIGGAGWLVQERDKKRDKKDATTDL